MDRDYIERKHVAARYLAGRLSDEEAQEYERAYLADPALAADLDLQARLKSGLRGLRERGELGSLLASQSGWPGPRFAWAAAILATAGLATMLALWIGEREARDDLEQQVDSLSREAATATITRVVRLDAVRAGSATRQLVDVGRADERIALLIDVTTLGSGVFDVRLVDATRRVRMEARGVEPRAGELLVVIASSLLKGADEFALEIAESGVATPAAMRLRFTVSWASAAAT